MLIGDRRFPTAIQKLDESCSRQGHDLLWPLDLQICDCRRKGRRAAIIVHETGRRVSVAVITGSWAANLQPRLPQRNADLVGVESWITSTAPSRWRRAPGAISPLKQAALHRDFRPIPLGARANITIKSQLRDINTRNVVGLIEGADRS